MKILGWIVTILMVLALPAALLTFAWTGDWRWLSTAVIIGAFWGLVIIIGRDE